MSGILPRPSLTCLFFSRHSTFSHPRASVRASRGAAHAYKGDPPKYFQPLPTFLPKSALNKDFIYFQFCGGLQCPSLRPSKVAPNPVPSLLSTTLLRKTKGKSNIHFRVRSKVERVCCGRFFAGSHEANLRVRVKPTCIVFEVISFAHALAHTHSIRFLPQLTFYI